MRRARWLIAVLAAVTALTPVSAAAATAAFHNFGPNLQADCPNPEGIALDPAGNLYAASFPLLQTQRTPSANICVLNAGGTMVDKFAIAPGPAGGAHPPREPLPGGRPSVGGFADGTAPHAPVPRL